MDQLFQHFCYLILAPINVIFTRNVISVYESLRCQQLLQHIHHTNAFVLEHCTIYTSEDILRRINQYNSDIVKYYITR